MVNEVLFMQVRVFREFINKYNLEPVDANRMFKKYGIWKYIEACYDVLHMSGDQCVLDDIEQILNAKGVQL